MHMIENQKLRALRDLYRFIQGMHMPKIVVKAHEHFDAALRRFKMLVEDDGLLKELRSREAYEKPTAKRKRKQASAVKRHLKKMSTQQLPKKLY